MKTWKTFKIEAAVSENTGHGLLAKIIRPQHDWIQIWVTLRR